MKNSDAFLLTFPVTLVVTLIIATILVLTLDIPRGLSFALGSITTLMMMSMLYKSTEKVLQNTDKVKAQRQTIKNYAFRYFFYALILVIAQIHPALDVVYVALGLFIFKICLYLVLLVQNKGGDTND